MNEKSIDNQNSSRNKFQDMAENIARSLSATQICGICGVSIPMKPDGTHFIKSMRLGEDYWHIFLSILCRKNECQNGATSLATKAIWNVTENSKNGVWSDIERKLEIQTVLDSLYIIQDMISLIQQFSKQDKLMVLGYDVNSDHECSCEEEDLYYGCMCEPESSRNILIYDPSCDTWETELSSAIFHRGSYKAKSFMKSDHVLITITQVLDIFEISHYMIDEYDLSHGQRLKSYDILPNTKIPESFKFGPNGFSGLCKVGWLLSTNQYILFDINKTTPFIINIDPKYNPKHTRLIYSPECIYGKSRIFALSNKIPGSNDVITRGIGELTCDGKWIERSPPLWMAEKRSMDIIYENKLFILGAETHPGCQFYDMLKNTWHTFPSLPSKVFPVPGKIHIVIDNCILVQSIKNLWSYNLVTLSGWKIVKAVPEEFCSWAQI